MIRFDVRPDTQRHWKSILQQDNDGTQKSHTIAGNAAFQSSENSLSWNNPGKPVIDS